MPLNDLKTGLIHKEYSVQQVGIVGVESIKKGMILEYDRKIIIEGKSFVPLPPARNKSCQPHDSRCNNKYKNKCINLFFPSQ